MSTRKNQDPNAETGRGKGHGGNLESLPKGKPSNRNKHSNDKNELTEMEALFVKFYCLYWNATKAALKAGYSEKTAYSTGSKLTKVPRVKAAIDAHLAQVKDDHRQTHEAITHFLMRIIYSDTTDLLSIEKDGNGKSVVSFKDSHALESGAGMLIDSITIGRHGIKIDIFSKQQALDMLNKHVGYYEQDNKQKVNTGPTIYLPDNGREDSSEELPV